VAVHSIECIGLTHAGVAVRSRLVSDVTSQRDCAARLSRRDFFALFDRVSDFDLLIGGRGIVMDHPCAEFGDIKYFSFSRFYFDRMTEAYQRYYSRNYRIGVSITTIRMTKMNNLLMMVLQ